MLADQEREAAQEIQKRLRTVLDGYRASQELMPRARQRGMARAILASREEMAALRQASADREEGERRKAYLAAFGLDLTRSAEDRELRAELAAAEPGAVETERRMSQALRVGDLLAARAVAAYAFDRRNDEMGGDAFRGVLDLFAGHSEGIERQMVSLASLDDDIGQSGAAKLARLGDKLLVEIQQPSDLPGNIGALASDDEPSGQPPMGMPFGA